MTIEERLRDYILSRYSSATDFCVKSGIASSTFFTMLKRGINNTSRKTISRICITLGLDQDALYRGEIVETSDHPATECKDVTSFIEDLESSTLTYKGEILTPYQKRMIAYAMRLSLKMHEKEPDPE